MIEKFLEIPYLPVGRTAEAIVGKGIKSFLPCFRELGIKIHEITPINGIQYPMQAHADCAFCPVSDNRFFLEPGQTALAAYVKAKGGDVFYLKNPLSNGYPMEARLNCLFTENALICNQKTVDSSVLSMAISEKYDIINTKQGYTKCSVAPVAPHAFLTDDSGLAKALSVQNDVLLVQKGSVQLENFPYGFIGGACMRYSKDMMLFLGDLSTHSDADSIRSFLRNYGIYSENASTGFLKDIGSVIPITEWSDSK